MATDRHSAAALPSAGDVLVFWRALGPAGWYRKDAAVDAEIRDKFQNLHTAAADGLLHGWESDAPGALGLAITLDQIPRNMYRGSAAAFATDPLARAVSGRAVERGFDRAVADQERIFFYLPLMHSEALADQERCCTLCRSLSDAGLLKYAELHADIIRRFGRFPHRNAVLGRVTTREEQAFLDGGGFSG